MIDIHCHPLYETDDGARSYEVSIEMLKMSAADGVTHVVATPHSNFKYRFNSAANQEKLAKLQAAIGESPKLLQGCDFHLSYENIRDLTAGGKGYSVNGTQYLLVEFDDHFIPELMDNVFYEIEVAGFTPILTHPERNAVCRSKLTNVYNWVSRGCLVQVTAQSYTGDFGSEPQRAVERLLDLNMVHIFASDAHDTRRRPPLLSPARQKAADERGEALAEALFVSNPGAVIRGEPLPPMAPPIAPAQRTGRRWWSFLKS